MKTVAALFAFVAFVVAAPFPTAPFPITSGTAGPSPTFPTAFPGAPMANCTHPPGGSIASGHLPSSPTGTAPVSLLDGTAPTKRDAQVGDSSSFAFRSLSLPTGGFGGSSGFAEPTEFGARPDGAGLGGSSTPSFSLPIQGFGGESGTTNGIPKISAGGSNLSFPASGVGSGIAAPTGASDFRRHEHYGSDSGHAGPSGFPGFDSFSPSSGVAAPTGGFSGVSISFPRGGSASTGALPFPAQPSLTGTPVFVSAAPTGLHGDGGYAGFSSVEA